MNILVRMPNWLGDSVMATPALDNLRCQLPDAKCVLVGSAAVVNLFQTDDRWHAVVEDAARGKDQRAVRLFRFGRDLCQQYGPFDVAFCLTNSFSSRWMVYWSGARRRVGLRRGIQDLLLTDAIRYDKQAHVAEVYNQVVNGYFGTSEPAGETSLHGVPVHRYDRPTLGINPGAAQGSARRWDPKRFGEVAAVFADRFDIAIFGGPKEEEIAGEVANVLRQRGIENFQNLAGPWSVSDMLSYLAGLDLFITNDTGPMHMVGAFGIPTVAIFGSSSHLQTHPWRNPRAVVVRHAVSCAPCFKAVCPLGHHQCMTGVSARQVIEAAERLLAAKPESDCDLQNREPAIRVA